jgi:hypothetical protein
MKPGQNSVERIRRHEVSRALKKVNLSPEEEEVINRFSRSLVGRLLEGPISEVMERAELSFGGRSSQEAPRGLERRRGADKGLGSRSDYPFRENGKPHVDCEFEIGSDRVSNKPA